MAKVQLANGYTKIANEIFEEMAKVKLSPTQYRLLFVIWRFTYGFQRKKHNMSLKFLSRATGCDTRQIQRELKKLEDRKIIYQDIKSGACRKISFNKYHNEWVGKSDVGKITIGKTDNITLGEKINLTIGEKDKQEIKEINKEKDHDKRKPKKPVPILEYEKLFGTPPPILAENFNHWIDNSQFQEPEKIICETIKRAKEQTPNKPAPYIQSILKNLHNLGLYTLEAVKKYNSKFDAKFNKSGAPKLTDMFDRANYIKNQKPLSGERLKEIKEMEEDFPF